MSYYSIATDNNIQIMIYESDLEKWKKDISVMIKSSEERVIAAVTTERNEWGTK